MRTAFLVMKDHPYGGEMLDRLVAAGCAPEAIIEEDSLLAVRERDKFRVRLAGQLLPPTPAEVARRGDIPLVRVADHNSPECLRRVRALAPEVILLGGTRVLKGPLLEGLVLNVHPGLLPWTRGSSPEAWSVHLDLPVGVTCHRVDAGVDTGPVLLRRLLELPPRTSYEALVRRNVALAAATMVEAVGLLAAGRCRFRPQEAGAWETRPAMPPARKLADGRYAPAAPPELRGGE